MSATLPRTTFPILAVEPEPAIPDGSWRHDPERSRRGKELSVYVVQSTSEAGVEYEVVFHHRTRLVYCTCLARVCCKHIRGVLYWMEHRSMVACYRAMEPGERERRRADFAAIARGDLVGDRLWRVDRDALARVLSEKIAA